MFPDITFLYAAILAIILVGFSILVVKERWRAGVEIGAGKSNHLHKIIRIHANFTEYVPFALLMMAFTEMSGAPILLVHIFGFILVLARLSHAYGLHKSTGPGIFRASGIIGTWLVLLMTAGWGMDFYISSPFLTPLP